MKDKIKCPKCGSTNIAKYLFGLLAYSEELMKKIEKKEIILGGCLIDDIDPTHHCNDCNYDFIIDD